MKSEQALIRSMTRQKERNDNRRDDFSPVNVSAKRILEIMDKKNTMSSQDLLG